MSEDDGFDLTTVGKSVGSHFALKKVHRVGDRGCEWLAAEISNDASVFIWRRQAYHGQLRSFRGLSRHGK
jgi:hypothetical protein